jgi:tetratricopeptide (TPR) repeat protein
MTEALAVNHGEFVEQNSVRPGREAISPETVRAQLERILNSKAFARSPRISRFLTFVVEQTLDGQESKLKEYLLGVEVFGRLDSFDPRIDSIVRVEARRLRYKLDRYYETEGHNDPIYIQFRKGCYVPSFIEKRPGETDGSGEIADIPYVRAIENPHAFALYARARNSLGTWTPDGIAEAVSCFSQALDEDQDCASAQAGAASAWMFTALLGLMPARDVVPKAKQAATRALVISPSISEAYSILGITSALYDWDWSEGESELRKAIHANPCDTAARVWYGVYLTLCGRSEDGLREARKAQQAAPTSLTAHLAVGFACHAGRAYDEALMQYRLAHDLNPSFYAPYVAMGLLFTDQRMYEQASHMLTKAAQMTPRNASVLAALAYGHAAAGRHEAFGLAIGELEQLSEKQYVPPISQAMAYSSAGNLEMAYRKLEEAVQEHSPWLPVIRFAPAFDAVRRDPRFDQLLERINLERNGD